VLYCFMVKRVFITPDRVIHIWGNHVENSVTIRPLVFIVIWGIFRCILKQGLDNADRTHPLRVSDRHRERDQSFPSDGGSAGRSSVSQDRDAGQSDVYPSQHEGGYRGVYR
jgi:hypothetical protein